MIKNLLLTDDYEGVNKKESMKRFVRKKEKIVKMKQRKVDK